MDKIPLSYPISKCKYFCNTYLPQKIFNLNLLVDKLEKEKIFFIIGEKFLISFQEKKGDHFEHVRYRLRENIGILRERSSDYLLYLLLESILDNYFKTIENIEEKVETFELIDINEDPSPSLLNSIEVYKRQIHFIKKTIIPIRDFSTKIERGQFSLIQQKHIKYFFEIGVSVSIHL